MYNHAPKDYKCPPCTLTQGLDNEINVQQDVVDKNSFVTIFIAAKWWKNNAASIIIVPNKHFENIYDLPSDYGHAIQDAAQKVAIELKKVYKCDGVSFLQHNEPAGTQEIFHYHLHAIPRYTNDEFYANFKNSRWVDKKERLPYAEKMKKYFKEHHE